MPIWQIVVFGGLSCRQIVVRRIVIRRIVVRRIVARVLMIRRIVVRRIVGEPPLVLLKFSYRYRLTVNLSLHSTSSSFGINEVLVIGPSLGLRTLCNIITSSQIIVLYSTKY